MYIVAETICAHCGMVNGHLAADCPDAPSAEAPSLVERFLSYVLEYSGTLAYLLGRMA